MIIPIKSKGEVYDIIIDDEDYEKFCEHNWYIHHQPNTKYCRFNITIDEKKTTLALHRFLMNLKHGDKRVINHKDGNGLNNKRSNLEICDVMYNSQSLNTKKRFGGIYFDNRVKKKKYQAEVKINKKRYKKHFYTKEEAQSYLDELEKKAKLETIPFQ